MNDFSQNTFFAAPQNAVKCARKSVAGISVALILWMLFSFTVAPAILLFVEYGAIKGTAILLEYIGFAGAVSAVQSFLGSEMWEQLYSLLAYVITMVFLLFAVKYTVKKSAYPYGAGNGQALKYSDGFMYKRLFPIYVLALAISIPFSAFVSVFTGIETIAGEQVIIPHTDAAFFVSFVATAILPPLLEEYVFRRLVIESLLPYGKALALVASSVFFAAVHINVPAIASAFAIGLILGIVYIKGKSLVPCIFLHIINNAVAFVQTSIMEFYPEKADMINSIFMLCVLFLGLGSISMLFGGKKKLWGICDDLSGSMECGQDSVELIGAKVFASPAFIILMIMIFLYEKLLMGA